MRSSPTHPHAPTHTHTHTHTHAHTHTHTHTPSHKHILATSHAACKQHSASEWGMPDSCFPFLSGFLSPAHRSFSSPILTPDTRHPVHTCIPIPDDLCTRFRMLKTIHGADGATSPMCMAPPRHGDSQQTGIRMCRACFMCLRKAIQNRCEQTMR